MTALTVRQERFVREYLVDGNGTQAAIRAGYACNSAAGMANHLLSRPHIRAELDRLRLRLLAQRDITPERVLEEYRRLAFSDIRGLFNGDGSMRAPHEWDDETAAAVAGLEVGRTKVSVDGKYITEEQILKVKRWDKVKALEVLAKYTGVLKDKGGDAPYTRTDQPLDPGTLARMDDGTLAEALALLARMDARTDTPTP